MPEGPKAKCDTANNSIIADRVPEATIQYPPCTNIIQRAQQWPPLDGDMQALVVRQPHSHMRTVRGK